MGNGGSPLPVFPIMPNQLQALFSFINTTQSINTIIRNCKRFMVYEIINLLEKNKETTLLERYTQRPWLCVSFLKYIAGRDARSGFH